MAMIAGDAASGTGLAGVIYTKLSARSWFRQTVEGQGLCNDIAAAVVSYVTANAVVAVSVATLTGLATGVTAGAAAVPVTGTGAGTGTIS